MRGNRFTLAAVALLVVGMVRMSSADEPQVTSPLLALDVDQVFDSPAIRPAAASVVEVEIPEVKPTRLAYEYPEQIFAEGGAGCGDSACGSGDSACGCGSVCGCGQPFMSDHAFDGFIEPISNPIWFMDPRSRTRARFVYINQNIPSTSVIGGGELQVFALQVSVALNERWSLIANKDGYNTLQTSGLASSASGHGDIATGLQYVFIRDTCNQFILSGGLIAEWSQGSAEVFQGNGDGTWNSYLTAGKELDERTHVIATVGWHLPTNGNVESESIWYSFHIDRQIGCTGLAAVWEVNGISYVDNGAALGTNQEGGDYINLGASDVNGNTFVSMAFGLNYILGEHSQFGGVWEVPVTSREDLFQSRTTLTYSLIY